ncbi:hypothetical protein HDV06_000979 [Boothiomyces sp. JEL0866]|nr:hypothetical protein HDV06_000979 [Boothiomyces sp. JEL0866]
MSDTEEWTVVTKKSKIKPFKKQIVKDNDALKPNDIRDKIPTLEPFIPIIAEEIPTSKPDCVCYGIGTLSQKSSQYQFALLVLLKSYFDKIFIYDPIMTENEIQYYKELGLYVLETNLDGKYKVGRPTVFYMPHCDNFLYDAVLEANFERLDLIYILGNSFQTYQDMLIKLPFKFLKQSFALVIETKIEINVGTAFNNLSWHRFKSDLDHIHRSIDNLRLK